ncbi:MAG: hypothetical protein KAV87_48265 [Desulfobacteraceae bacterium]|nr:hypothetical protein [Desulfobacteraceae bacterium]
MSTQTLDDIFNGTDPNEAPAVPETPPAQETPQEQQAEADEGQDPKGESKAEETPAAKEEPPASENDRMVPLKALEAERKKRQKLEDQIAQAPAEPPKPAPDILEDQKGFEDHIQQTVDTALYNQRLSMSEIAAKKAHENFDEMVETFIGLAQDNPALGQAMRAHSDPAEFAYQEAQKSIAMQEIGSDPVAFREQIRQEVEAEIREKLEAEAKANAEGDTLRNIPTSLANEPSVAARGKPEWEGEASLEDILTRTGDRGF